MAWRSEFMFSMKEITRRLRDVLQDRYGEHLLYLLASAITFHFSEKLSH